MKSTLRMLSLMATLTAMVLASGAAAQMGPGKGQGMGMGPRHYDPSTVVTVKGTVQDLQSNDQGRNGRMGGVGTHLVLKTDKESMTVLVGPSSFLTEKNFSLAKGDKIEVTGSKVKYGGSDAIIAREIKKGDAVLTLRNEQGVPQWSMGPQR